MLTLPNEMPSIEIIVIMLGIFFVMGKMADFTVRALTNLGKIFRIGAFSLSFVLLGLTTSLPEIFIGVYSVVDGIPTLALGTLVGGTIVLLTLVTGLNGILFSGIALDGKFVKYSLCKILPRVPVCNRVQIHDLGILGIIFIAPAFLLSDGRLTRIDGFILTLLYLFFVWYYLHEPQNHTNGLVGEKPPLFRNVATFLFSILALIVSARVITSGSEVLLTRLNIPPFLFGVIVLGVGTNLPELMIMLRARKASRDISVGNTLGSAAANTLLIGLLALVAPMSSLVQPELIFTVGILVITVLFFIFLFHTRNVLSRIESCILVLIYILFLIGQNLLR